MNNDQDIIDLTYFKVVNCATQLVGTTLVLVIATWIELYMGGLGWTSNQKLEFNWHPLLMTIGIILYGNSIIIYRSFRQIPKRILKTMHALVHGIVFFFIVIGLQAAFDSHNLAVPPIPNMFSLHSWLGLGAVILFAGQWIIGFGAFLYPGVKDNVKESIMPFHVYFGLYGFVLAIASALMGLTEKAFSSINEYPNLPKSGVIVNGIGILLAIFGALVVYLASEPSYKRRPLPVE